MSIQARNLETLQHFPLHPLAQETVTFTGATTNIADLQQFEGDVQIILDSGAAAASGTLTCTIETSDATGSGWGALTGAAFTAVAQAASKQVLTVSDVDRKRYIRLVGTIAASGTTTYSVNGYAVKKYQ
jgi:hypothetical protein